jgi:hypothetical protein
MRPIKWFRIDERALAAFPVAARRSLALPERPV